MKIEEIEKRKTDYIQGVYNKIGFTQILDELISEKKRFIELQELFKSENKRWSNELDLQLKYSEYERKKNTKLTKEVDKWKKDHKELLNIFMKSEEKNTKLKEQLKDIKSQLFDVSKPLDPEIGEALDEFSKTQGTKKPKKKRF